MGSNGLKRTSSSNAKAVILNTNNAKVEYTISYRYSGYTITLFTGTKGTEDDAAQRIHSAIKPYNPLINVT